MLVTDEGMSRLSNELHPAKACFSILVTDAGMATRTNETHSKKAFAPMLVKDVGNVTLFTVVLSTPHSRHESRPPPPKRLSRSGWVMLAVPSGMSKCTCASGGGGRDTLRTDLMASLYRGGARVRDVTALPTTPFRPILMFGSVVPSVGVVLCV